MANKKTVGVDPFTRCIPVTESGCWLWEGVTNEAGYGRVYTDGRDLCAHRLAWTRSRGPIPKGLIVCHKCDTPACINPAHLFLGTYADNAIDMCSKGRGAAQKRKKCVNGHEFTTDNTRMDVRGARVCTTCDKARSAKARPNVTAYALAKTHCRKGHALTGGNRREDKYGRPSCRECGNAASLLCWRRKHAPHLLIDANNGAFGNITISAN